MPAQSPAEIHTLFRNAFNAGDVEALLALYAPDALLVFDGKAVSGCEHIRNALESMLVRRGRMTLETRSAIESPQGLALLHGVWVVERATGTGSGLVTRSLSTEVVRRQPDGTWLFVIDDPFSQRELTIDAVKLMREE